MITFTQIISSNGTALYKSTNEKLTFHTSGNLSILYSQNGMMLMKLNNFQYGINPTGQITYDDKDPHFKYTFYLPLEIQAENWILKVNQNADAVFSCLQETCYLKNKNTNQITLAKKYEYGESKLIQIKEQESLIDQKNGNVEKTQTNKNEGVTIGDILVGVSIGINTGLKFAGKWIGYGFTGLGDYVSTKVSKNQEETKFNKETKQNIEKVAKTTNKVFTYTTEQLGNLFKFGKGVVADMSQKFQNSEKGKQIKQNKYYQTLKYGTQTGAKVISNLYDGFINAVYYIGSGVVQGTNKVIAVKYGKQAQQVSNGMMQSAGNIYKICKSPYEQAANTFKD